MVKEIALFSGEIALVDDDDYDQFATYRWYLIDGYAKATVWQPETKRKRTLSLHRMVTKAVKGTLIDHVNGNRLDNRKANLRIADRKSNTWNRKPLAGKLVKYKGVSRNSANTWQANIECKGIKHWLGCFPSPEEAALAYNRAAREHFGEFAFLNVIEGHAA